MVEQVDVLLDDRKVNFGCGGFGNLFWFEFGFFYYEFVKV